MGCRAFALRGCVWRRGCSGRRMARPLCVPVGGGPPASRPRCELRSARRLEARPGPAAAHRHRGRSLRRPPHRRRLWFWCARPGPATASSISHAIPSDVFHGLKCDRWNSADSALVWGRAKLELHAELREFPCPWSSLLLRGIALLG